MFIHVHKATATKMKSYFFKSLAQVLLYDNYSFLK